MSQNPAADYSQIAQWNKPNPMREFYATQLFALNEDKDEMKLTSCREKVYENGFHEALGSRLMALTRF
jgi:hypothetical protein